MHYIPELICQSFLGFICTSYTIIKVETLPWSFKLNFPRLTRSAILCTAYSCIGFITACNVKK